MTDLNFIITLTCKGRCGSEVIAAFKSKVTATVTADMLNRKASRGWTYTVSEVA